MQEQAPSLPEVDATSMASLQTLAQIVEHLNGFFSSPYLSASPATPVASPSMDLQSLLLSVVAEKTGYPTEMLNLEMSLEGDLGIDSIKRVEILSAMQEQAPSSRGRCSSMASLETLAQIVEHLNGATQQVEPVHDDTMQIDLQSLLLSVVAEKTGYPTEMLNLEMSLEGDLGIDSIKRVEILSALQEQAPSLPEVDAASMASLQTLAQIVDLMRRASEFSQAEVSHSDISADTMAFLAGSGASSRSCTRPLCTCGLQCLQSFLQVWVLRSFGRASCRTRYCRRGLPAARKRHTGVIDLRPCVHCLLTRAQEQLYSMFDTAKYRSSTLLHCGSKSGRLFWF